MAKEISFAANMPLTAGDMNKLLQDGQIVQTTGVSESDLMSQKAVTDELTALAASKENVIAKATAFNKDFGALPGTVCEGNDARLSDSRPCNNTFDDPATAKSNLSLDRVDNTSDADKPLSAAMQTALDAKANTSGNYPNLTAGNVNKLGGKAAELYVDVATPQTITGNKTFTGSIRIGLTSGGKIDFGDQDRARISEYSKNCLEIKANRFKLAGTEWDSASDKIPASMIDVGVVGAAFGNATTLADVIYYIAKVFHGQETVSMLCANTFDAK